MRQQKRRAGLALCVLTVAAMLATGCGEMTMRTWIVVDDQLSGGQVSIGLPGGVPTLFPMTRLQGGFLAEVKLNTAQLPGPMYGSIELVDVRMAGEVSGPIGKLCTWNDPAGSSGGPLTVDLLGGTTETQMFLDAKATTQLSEALGMAAVDFEQDIDFDLGAGLGIDTFLGAFVEGSAAGLFQTSSTIASEMNVPPFVTVFEMNTVVNNGPQPPIFDDDLLAFCADDFATQGVGNATYFGLNAKSSYMRKTANDDPKDPLVIDLDELGVLPGDTLRLSSLGRYSWLTILKDGVDTNLGGVFSQTDVVLPAGHLDRVADAIDAGPNINTWLSIWCWFGQCYDAGGDDIAHDFPISPGGLNITVPSGAHFLVVAPIDGFRHYKDNTGMGFGVQLEILP